MVVRVRPAVLFVSIILMSLALFSGFIGLKANPIPSVPAILEAEYINITIEKISENEATVLVDGTYPMKFTNEEGFVYFPIPKEVLDNGAISVFLDDKKINYNITWSGTIRGESFQYETSLGTLPMISFPTPTNTTDTTIVRIIYTYRISTLESLEYEFFRTLYAMGTGRYYLTYAKECTASVNIWIKSFEGYEMMIFFDAGPHHVKDLTIFSKKIESAVERYHIEKTAMFGGLVDDLIIVLRKQMDIVESAPRNVTLESLSLEGGYFKGRLVITLDSTRYIAKFLDAEYKEGAINVYLSVVKKQHVVALPVIKNVPMDFVVPCNISKGDIDHVSVNVYVNGAMYKSFLVDLDTLDTGDIGKEEGQNVILEAIVASVFTIAAVSVLLITAFRRGS